MPEGPTTYDSKNPAIAIWQPCLLALNARVEPGLALVLVGRRDGPAEGDGELGRDERVLLVVRDERVQRVEEDLKALIHYMYRYAGKYVG